MCKVLERETDHSSSPFSRRDQQPLLLSLLPHWDSETNTTQSQQTHMHICTNAQHSQNTHVHTQVFLIGWPKVTDIICYGVRPQSHPERPEASAVTPPPKRAGGAREGGRVKKRQIEGKLAQEDGRCRRRGGTRQRQKHKVAPSSLIRNSNWTNSRWQRCACQIRSCPIGVRQRRERAGGTLLRAKYHS